jgi:hypothetical protein
MKTIVDTLLEVTIAEEEDFLKIKETLTRIGIASKKENTLFQSCHILHKKGRYYITHFKEMFALDGKHTDMSDDDYDRRNTIANLLEEWKLLKIVNKKENCSHITINKIRIISHKEKNNWSLQSKYTIGKKH